jgi:hypothetical protein
VAKKQSVTNQILNVRNSMAFPASHVNAVSIGKRRLQRMSKRKSWLGKSGKKNLGSIEIEGHGVSRAAMESLSFKIDFQEWVAEQVIEQLEPGQEADIEAELHPTKPIIEVKW